MGRRDHDNRATGELVGWAAISSLWQLYGVFALMGIAMAAVLYGPAFTVIAKLFWPAPRRAMTVLTLVGGLAAILFTPLTQWLVQSTGWRATLIILAGITVVLTALPHAAFMPRDAAVWARQSSADGGVNESSLPDDHSITVTAAIRGTAFWALTLALFLAFFISVALVVHLIPYLTGAVSGYWAERHAPSRSSEATIRFEPPASPGDATKGSWA